ncbi:MAG: D-hexose-6-phosphate mutarotase [Luteolibacter sp.]
MKPHEIPGHVTFSEGHGGLIKLAVETEWSTAEIYLQGAHVTRFHKKGDAPLLFVSEESEFIKGKPIRGGVPIIFPWFGGREGLPAHGFARTSEWSLVESSVLADGVVKLRFRLPTLDALDVDFVVQVGEQLTMELLVTNTGAKDATFETCLHTYFQIGAIDSISIKGLTGCSYIDKVLDGTFTETAESIRIESEVDRVYFDTTAAVEIIDAQLRRKIFVTKSGSNSTVVWNPWIAKSQRMPDFGNEEYLHMVCVESGNVANDRVTLAPGSQAAIKVVLCSEPLP